MNKLKIFKTLCMAHPYFIIAAIALLVFLPAFTQKLWIIDDHEIVWFLSTLHTDGWSGFWHQWLQLPDFGSLTRFRPIYYLLRATEILLWRDNAFLWVLARFLMVFIFAASIFQLSSRFFSKSISLIFASATIGVPWLSGTFFRLGPSEAYAVFFMALLIFSLVPKNRGVCWLGVVFCITMLIGIKENFIVLIPLGGWAVYELVRERKITSAILASVFFALSLSFIAVVAYKLHASSGVDVYNQSVGSGRLNKAINSLFFTKFGWISISLLYISIFLYVLLFKIQGKLNKLGLIVFLACVAILGFNLYFYAGVPGTRSRYAIPYWIIMLSMPAVLSARIYTTNLAQRWLVDKRFIPHLLKTGVFIILIGMFTQNISKGYQYANITIATNTAILEIQKKAKSVDEIIVRTVDSIEYEPVMAIPRFLKYKRISKPLFLSVGNDKGKGSRLSRGLKKVLARVELNGGSGYSPARKMSNNDARCLEVVFTASAPNICAARVILRPF